MSSKEIKIRCKSDWIWLCDITNNWLVRANNIGKSRVVQDSSRDRSQESLAQGFVRAKPSSTYVLRKKIEDQEKEKKED